MSTGPHGPMFGSWHMCVAKILKTLLQTFCITDAILISQLCSIIFNYNETGIDFNFQKGKF